METSGAKPISLLLFTGKLRANDKGSSPINVLVSAGAGVDPQGPWPRAVCGWSLPHPRDSGVLG